MLHTNYQEEKSENSLKAHSQLCSIAISAIIELHAGRVIRRKNKKEDTGSRRLEQHKKTEMYGLCSQAFVGPNERTTALSVVGKSTYREHACTSLRLGRHVDKIII